MAETEAALAAQLVAIHLLQMKVAARAIRFEYDTKTVAVAGKLARTFVMQLEALQRLRGRQKTSRQSIRVKKKLHQHFHYHRGMAKQTDNPKQRQPLSLKNCPRCQARTKAGKSCRSPAVKGKRVCRVHGGKGSGAPRGDRNGNWKHGGDTQEARALRKVAQSFIRGV